MKFYVILEKSAENQMSVCLVTDCSKTAEFAMSENRVQRTIRETESVYLSDAVKSQLIAVGERDNLREIVRDLLEAEYDITEKSIDADAYDSLVEMISFEAYLNIIKYDFSEDGAVNDAFKRYEQRILEMQRENAE